MTVSSGLDLTTGILLFGWIPFWWIVALITLYRMNQNDRRDQIEEIDPI